MHFTKITRNILYEKIFYITIDFIFKQPRVCD